MAGEENLIPFTERTEEEQREIARKGGIASGIARRRKRDMKEAVDLLLSLPCKLKTQNGDSIREMAKELGIDEDEIDNQMAVAISMFIVASAGGKNSVGAATFLRDTVGDKPKEEIEISTDTDETIKEVDEYLCKKKQN